MATDLLVTPADIEAWTQRAAGSLENDTLAIRVCAGVTVLIREYGSADWTLEPNPVAPSIPLPPRAKLIADIAAKNYYDNPTSLTAEGTGPLSETKLTDAVHNMTLNETEIAILAELAGLPVPGQVTGGLWVQPIMRDDALLSAPRGADFYVPDQSGSDWEIPWVRMGDNLYPREI